MCGVKLGFTKICRGHPRTPFRKARLNPKTRLLDPKPLLNPTMSFSIRKRTSQQVSLILDNVSSHRKELFDPKGQIKVYALPHNTTARLQPMDAGIIAALKCKYKYDQTLVEVVSRLDGLASEHFGDCKRGTRGLQEGAEPHILDAIELCSRAWSDISERTVARCWAHTGVLPRYYTRILRDKWPRRLCFVLFGMHWTLICSPKGFPKRRQEGPPGTAPRRSRPPNMPRVTCRPPGSPDPRPGPQPEA